MGGRAGGGGKKEVEWKRKGNSMETFGGGGLSLMCTNVELPQFH